MDQSHISALEAKKTELLNKLRQMEYEYNTIMGQAQGIDIAISTLRSNINTPEMAENLDNKAILSPVAKSLKSNRRLRLATDKQKIYECLRDAGTPISGEEVAKRTGLQERYTKQTLLKVYLYQDHPKDLGRDGDKYFLTEEGKKFLSSFPPLIKDGLAKQKTLNELLEDIIGAVQK